MVRKFKVNVDGQMYTVEVEELTGGETAKKQDTAPAPAAAKPAPAPDSSLRFVKAPLRGTITSVRVKVGDKVEKGQVVLTLEAMKLDNELVAPVAGTVAQILVNVGDTVETGQELVGLQE
ncbi:MAG TPA: biotin/lipoyl-binding protein [Firmicutes bacterium]|jgi:biotin carboxyl carrier protein|nr:biotin/lipoyl-binding protein [Bacillota bacterium]